jgi:hypothetical protein
MVSICYMNYYWPLISWPLYSPQLNIHKVTIHSAALKLSKRHYLYSDPHFVVKISPVTLFLFLRVSNKNYSLCLFVAIIYSFQHKLFITKVLASILNTNSVSARISYAIAALKIVLI